MRFPARLLLSGSLWALTACQTASIGGEERCESSSDCVGGQFCVDGLCRNGGASRDWSPGADGGGSAPDPYPGGALDSGPVPVDTGLPDVGGTDGGVPDASGDEECDNGVDDDVDGRIDESCPCTLGRPQPCYPGDPSLLGTGVCRPGLQECRPEGEFLRWGECEGAVLPSEEECGDGLDNDCDGEVDGSCGCADTEICGNGVDDDCNGVVDDPASCCEASDAPEVLIVLDRSMSMHRRPNGSSPSNTVEGRLESKWGLAVTVIDQVVAELGGAIRFGLELFPADRPGCVTLPQRLMGVEASNGRCHAGTVVVPPTLDASPLMSEHMGVDTTPLCRSTPIGSSLRNALIALGTWSTRPRYVLLVTDGAETCESDPVDAVAELQQAGIDTYVVAFSGNIDRSKLNKMACTGHTAFDFETSCRLRSGGRWVPTGDGPRDLFFRADSGADLDTALRAIAGDICGR